MKRTIPQKVRSVPACADEGTPAIEGLETTFQESTRRACNPATMLGVALSVGACGLLLPQHKAAIAADPAPVDSLTIEPATQGVSLESALPTAAPQPTEVAIAATETHTVQDGQTLWTIAKLYRIDTASLASLNGLSKNEVLRVGQVLKLPVGAQLATVPTLPGVETEQPNLSRDRKIVVASTEASAYALSQDKSVSKEKQDTAIAKLKTQRDRLNASLAELRSEESKSNQAKANHSESNDSEAGKLNGAVVATIPVLPSQAAQPTLVSHQVTAGETLSTIAKTYGVSSRELIALNQINNPDLLRKDQVIKIPQSLAVADKAATSQTKLPTVGYPQGMVQPSAEAIRQGVGGESIALVNTNASGESVPDTIIVEPNAQDLRNQRDQQNYVDGLMAEVNKLRQKYRTQKPVAAAVKPKVPQRAAAPVPRSMALNAPTTVAINPELKPGSGLDRVLKDVRVQTEQRQERVITAPALPTAIKPQPQRIARASVGAPTYAPVVQASVRRMVSPDLPPIGGSENYLPGSKGAFNGYLWPAKGMFTSGYGWRWGRMHRGIDIAGPVGTPILAAAAGKVVYSGYNDGGYGYMVEVQHADGSMTRYAHHNRNLVAVGQEVAQGQQIAEMGSTGFSTGPHLHFEIHLPGQGSVNPMAYLAENRG